MRNLKYRKRPVEIEAMQWSGDNFLELDAWMSSHGETAHRTYPASGKVEIDTLEGTMTANLGDWIIRGVQGEFYPCKPDIFQETYMEAGGPDLPDLCVELNRHFIPKLNIKDSALDAQAIDTWNRWGLAVERHARRTAK